MRKLLNDIFTENDNKTFCLARIASTICLIVFLLGAIFDLYVSSTFDFGPFATGAATLLSGSGIMIGAKQMTSKT